MIRDRFDSAAFWVAHHGAAFLVSVFAVFSAVGFVGSVSVIQSPPEVVATEQAYISESSRDVGETPMAVASRRDGSKVFVEGVFVAGDAVTLPLDANGDVVHVSRAEYWVIVAAFSFLAGGFGLIPGMIVLYRAEGSNAARRHARQRAFFRV